MKLSVVKGLRAGKNYGLKDDGSVITDFDLIEMDEGRWYPEMWRNAWK